MHYDKEAFSALFVTMYILLSGSLLSRVQHLHANCIVKSKSLANFVHSLLDVEDNRALYVQSASPDWKDPAPIRELSYPSRIAVDGSFGPETKAACRVVANGDKGLLVSLLQACLLVHGIQETKIDASFGDGTEEGVREFQQRASTGVDGIAGPGTFEKLLN